MCRLTDKPGLGPHGRPTSRFSLIIIADILNATQVLLKDIINHFVILMTEVRFLIAHVNICSVSFFAVICFQLYDSPEV